MNILILATDVFTKGGIQRYTRYQVRALRENPDLKHVFLFSLLGKDPRSSFEEDIAVDYSAGGISLLKKAIFIIRVLFFCRNHEIDLIICNHVSLGRVALLVKTILRIPYLVDIHGLEVWSGLRYGEVIGLKNADGVISVSRFTLSYVEKRLNIPLRRTFLLYNCIDMTRFAPLTVPDSLYLKYGIPKEKKLVVTVGRLDRDKGQEMVIRSLKILPEDVFYLIVGDGARRSELEILVDREGVSGRVIFTDRVVEEDLVPLYNVGNVICLISRFSKKEGEGFGLALIEASACAKPVLGGDEDGSVEAVLNGESGVSLSPNDPSRIAEKLEFLLTRPEQARSMGLEGRRYVEKNFSYDLFREKQWNIIREVSSLVA